MEQVKVVFNNEIKRTLLPDTHKDFINILKCLYIIPERFSIYYFDNNNVKIYITDNLYKDFKNSVEKSQKTIKVFIGPNVEENSLNPGIIENYFSDSFISIIKKNIDCGLNNLKKLYEEAKIPELVQHFNKESNSVFNKINEKLKAFCVREDDNSHNEVNEKYSKQFKFIRFNFMINRRDIEILELLKRNEGDIDKTLSDLFH